MDPTSPTPAAPTPDQGAPQPTFLQQLAAQSAPPAAGAPAPAAAPGAAPKPDAGAGPNTPAADEPPAWLKELGDYKTPDEVKTRLASVEELQKNQLTAEQRNSLRLLSEPEQRREYLRLLDADYTALDDEAVLRQAFKAQYPSLDDEALEVRFQREQDAQFPGLANEPEDRDYKADAAMRKVKADAARAQFGQERDAKIKEFEAAGPAADGPSPEEVKQKKDAHLGQVEQLFGRGADAFNLTLTVDGAPLNLAVEAADLPAVRAVMENPFASFVKTDPATGQEVPDYAALQEFAVLKATLPKLFSQARKAALEGQGAMVPLDELHNGNGHNPNQRPADTASFSEQLAAQGGAKPARRKY